MNRLSNLNKKSRGNFDKTKSILIKNALFISLSMHFFSSPAHALSTENIITNKHIKVDSTAPSFQLAQNTAIPTKKYIVNIGETAQSISKHFNIDVDYLQSLNKDTDLLKGLKAGDIILVPLVSFAKNIPIANKSTLVNNNETQNKIAQMAAQVGSMLDTNPNSDAASAMARNIATSTVNNSLEKWFSQYGRLRAQVSVDEKFSLKNSQYDLLLPIWENKQNLIFTQASVHRTDDRNQANLGFGVRRFNENFMIGGNTFIDYDMSNDHSRAGIGGEYWSNFFKISANGYLRLSNWKDSKKVEDYEERAANGWDIRTEGYLPAYPQLGGKLMYEKYYGNEVALFGKDNRQENPQALTLGVSYTPIPLITMNAEHKQGQDGKKDTLIGVQMNYQFGVPWAKQIDPKAVSALRSLAGNRYDFIERNNNIVLEYRKKETIFLNIAKHVRGFSGEQKSLEVSIQTKYGLDRIEWDAKEIIAQGGEIIPQGSDYAIKLPDYKYGRSAPANTYTVSAIAYDTQGNASDRQTSQIEVTEAAVSNINSEFTPATATLVANGTNTQVLKLTIKDYKGNPIHVPASEIDLNISSKTRGNIAAKVSDWNQITDGEFEVTVTAGTQVEMLTLTPIIRGVSLDSAKIEMVAGDINELNSTLAVTPAEIVADGKQESSIVLNLKDTENNAIKGKTVSFSVGGIENTTISAVTDLNNGSYRATLTGTKAGTATITAYVDGVALKLKDEVTLKAGAISETNSDLKANPKEIIANGDDKTTLSLTLKDAQNNPINSKDVTFKVTGLNNTTVSTIQESNGVYTATLSGTSAGVANIQPVIDGVALNLTDSVAFKAGALSENTSSIAATPKSIVADGKESSLVSLTLKDKNDNPVSAKTVTFTVSGLTDTTFSATKETNGVYTAQLTGLKAGTAIITPNVDGVSLSINDSITLTPGLISETTSLLEVSPKSITADNISTSTVSLTLKDENENLIKGQKVEFLLDGLSNTTVSSVTENNGIYTATIKGSKAGVVSISPKVNGVNLDIIEKIELTAGAINEVHSIFTASPLELVANGKDNSELTLTLKDEHDNLVSEKDVSFKVSGLTNTTITATQESKGVYTAKLTGTKAGVAKITPIVDNKDLSLTEEVKFKASAVDATTSVMKASPETIFADGKTTSVITLELVDSNKNPVDEGIVTFEATGVAGTTLSKVEYKNGVYTANLSGNQVGNVTITPSFNGTQLNMSQNVKLSQAIAGIITTVNNEKVKVGEAITLRVIPQDSFGYPVPNAEVTLNFSALDRQKSTRTDSGKLKLNNTDASKDMKYTTNSDGEVVLTLTDPNGIGVEHIITASVDGGFSTNRSVYFTVLTSPDTDKAQMWGHMSNAKLTAKNGTTFSRPKVAREVSGFQDTYVENNETWPLFNAQSEGIYSYCSSGNIPSSTDYLRLFDVYGTSIPTTYGWPKDKLYRSSTSGLSGKYAYWLNTGKHEHDGIGNYGTAVTYNGYAVCK